MTTLKLFEEASSPDVFSKFEQSGLLVYAYKNVNEYYEGVIQQYADNKSEFPDLKIISVPYLTSTPEVQQWVLSKLGTDFKQDDDILMIILKDGKELSLVNPSAIKLYKATKETVCTDDLNSRLQKLVKRNPVMLFMKGDPSNPRCKFSRATIDLLSQVPDAKFGTFDILQDEEVRQGLKTFSNWPTFPQLYVKGELIGGLDIMKEMHEAGELKDTLLSA